MVPAGKRLLQVWMYQAQEESTLEATAATAKGLGFDGLLIKAFDGSTFMGAFDHGQDSIHNVAQATAQCEAVNAMGLLYYVWGVPLQEDDLQHQADIVAGLALATDGVFLDVEPYHQFWGVSDEDSVHTFMQEVRRQAPNATIILQPDPRPGRLHEIRADVWMQYCDALAGQHYFTSFASSVEAELSRAEELEATYGKPVIPTLSFAGASVAEIRQFITDPRVQKWGYIAWRNGILLPDHKDLLQQMGDEGVLRELFGVLWGNVTHRVGYVWNVKNMEECQHAIILIKEELRRKLGFTW